MLCQRHPGSLRWQQGSTNHSCWTRLLAQQSPWKEQSLRSLARDEHLHEIFLSEIREQADCLPFLWQLIWFVALTNSSVWITPGNHQQLYAIFIDPSDQLLNLVWKFSTSALTNSQQRAAPPNLRPPHLPPECLHWAIRFPLRRRRLRPERRPHVRPASAA